MIGSSLAFTDYTVGVRTLVDMYKSNRWCKTLIIEICVAREIRYAEV